MLDPLGQMVSEHVMGETLINDKARINDKASLVRLDGRPIARMNGVGNAIVVLDLRGCNLVVTDHEARAINAVPGLSFDQLMVIHDPAGGDADAFLRIYNTDGSPSGACGNGTRCVAWFMLRQSERSSLHLTTSTALLDCHRIDEWHYAVDMGVPSFQWDEIPLAHGDVDPRSLDLGGPGRAFALGIGNPHAVFFVDDADAIDLAKLGPPIEWDEIFPERANVSFAEVRDRSTIKLRVWERGAGATLGCGTGACAALVAAAETGRTDRMAGVELPGGRLEIQWRDDDHIVMSGPVALEHLGVLDARHGADRAA